MKSLLQFMNEESQLLTKNVSEQSLLDLKTMVILFNLSVIVPAFVYYFNPLATEVSKFPATVSYINRKGITYHL